MTLIAQNDSGTVTNANTYATRTFADDYFAQVSNSEWSSLSSSDKEKFLAQAFRNMERLYLDQWLGLPLTSNQNSAFPRKGIYKRVYNKCPEEILGIPIFVKQAQCEYANFLINNSFFNPIDYDSSGQVLSESVTAGPVVYSATYSQAGASTIKRIPEADFLLVQFLIAPGTVYRG